MLHFNDFNQERIFLVSGYTDFPVNSWNQLTVVVDNDARTVRFYLNGNPIGVVDLPDYLLRTQSPLVFGYAEQNLGFYGLMNNVVIYDRALSQDEVWKLVTQCTADVNEDGLLDIYDFSDFVNCFEGNSCPPNVNADFNEDGFVDIFDFTDFVVAFETGC